MVRKEREIIEKERIVLQNLIYDYKRLGKVAPGLKRDNPLKVGDDYVVFQDSGHILYVYSYKYSYPFNRTKQKGPPFNEDGKPIGPRDIYIHRDPDHYALYKVIGALHEDLDKNT